MNAPPVTDTKSHTKARTKTNAHMIKLTKTGAVNGTQKRMNGRFVPRTTHIIQKQPTHMLSLTIPIHPNQITSVYYAYIVWPHNINRAHKTNWAIHRQRQSQTFIHTIHKHTFRRCTYWKWTTFPVAIFRTMQLNHFDFSQQMQARVCVRICVYRCASQLVGADCRDANMNWLTFFSWIIEWHDIAIKGTMRKRFTIARFACLFIRILENTRSVVRLGFVFVTEKREQIGSVKKLTIPISKHLRTEDFSKN